MKIRKISFFYLFIFLFSSCAGYEIVQTNNIFKKHGVKRLRVPLFINRTIFPSVSAKFTNALLERLHSYTGLSVDLGEPSKPGDDVLIGIITTGTKKSEVLTPLIRTYTGSSSSLRNALGSRPDFFVTSQYSVQMNLELILIKSPLINGKKQGASPTVEFHHSVPISFNVVNNVNGDTGPDSAGVTNYTNNRGIIEFELNRAAQKYAQIMENYIGF